MTNLEYLKTLDAEAMSEIICRSCPTEDHRRRCSHEFADIYHCQRCWRWWLLDEQEQCT